ncbi:MAG TPA: glycine-rich protein, partial [Gaiellaceae bacterium]|nr:glycine-rich protein [Gaiellaceae bacterium]
MAASLVPPTAAGATCQTGIATATFSFTGSEQCYVVPAGWAVLQVVAHGAPGETVTTNGGYGAQVSARVPVVAGETLYVEVGGLGSGGQGGFNGGGSGAGGGGGASDVRTCSVSDGSCNSLSSRLVVA